MTDIVERGPAELAEAKTPDEADLVRREVEALIAVVRKAPAKAIEVNWAPLLRLRLDAWRRWGELLGEPEPGGNNNRSSDKQSDGEYKSRERARKLAFEVPDDAYFRFRASERIDKLTLAGALRLVPRRERNEPKVGGDYKLIHSAIADLDLKDVDVIVTDPPYPREYLPQWRELRDFAARALKPGGLLFAMSGQSWLPDVFAQMTGAEALNYRWTLAYLTPGGQSPALVNRSVNSFWKPVLCYVNGEYSGKWLGDVARSEVNDNDKLSHEWGQSESGFMDLMERASEPDDLVVDPFVGGGATAVAALKCGCRFIGADIDEAALEETRRRLA